VDGAVLRGPDAGEQLEGSIIGGREILRLLGAGGMGQVYLSKSIRTGRLDALKVMRPDMATSADAVSRFNREAMNAARIQHPNVAIVYDVGDTEDGVPYLAMEYVEGQSLSELLKRASFLPPMRVAAIVRQIGDALHAAHELGIVHRDLKPENVMLARHGAAEVVKLVDFGISKVAGAADQQLTSTGVAIGSPAYMSPEQVMAGADVTSRSDIYSLGLVTYRMLTGRLPFDGEGGELMMARVVHAPQSLAKARPDVVWSDEAEGVLAKALALDAGDRYADAVNFAHDFERAVHQLAADEPTAAFEPAERGKAAPVSPRHAKPAWGRIAGLTGGGLVVVAVGVWMATRPDGSRAGEAGGGVRQPVTAATLPPAGRKAPAGNAANSKSPGGPRATAAKPISFAGPSLRIRAAGLTPAMRRSVDSAVRVAAKVSAVTVVDAATARADLDLLPDATGRITVRGALPHAASIAAAADSVLAFVRYELATRDLEGLTAGALRGDLTFDFDRRSPEMHVGDSFRFRLRSLSGGYLTILDVAPSGNLTVLNPNTMVADVSQLSANAETVIPSRDKPAIATGPPAGPGQLWAIVTDRPLNLPQTISNDAAMAAAQIRREVERIVRSGNSPWSAVVLPYELKAGR
jgi:serine/threonine-protein kinase